MVMNFAQQIKGGGLWVRRVEHIVLRVVSLAFSLGSAHAIRWFFSPLDGVDMLMPTITWVIAVGFGVLGYFVSRGLAHRLMTKEPIWAYAPIVIVVEFVEVFCNYALAAAVIQRATWLMVVPSGQQHILTTLTYVALSSIPLVSVLLAVVDVDLDRSKQGGGVHGRGGPSLWGGAKMQPKSPSPMSYPAGNGYQGYQGTQAKGGQNGASPLGPTPVVVP